MSSPTVRIGDLCEQIRGVSYSKSDAILEPKAGFSPILRANNITETGLKYGSLVYVPNAKIKDKQRIRKGDVVIAASSGSIEVVGKAASARNDFDGGFGAFCKVLRPKSTVDQRYFAHYFQTKKYRAVISGLAAGANINNLKNEHLDELPIPLPPLPEQRRIAAILDKADELRQKRRQAIEKLDQLLQSVFLDMFGDPVANPKGWSVRPFTKCGKFVSGATPSKDNASYWGGDTPWVSPKDMKVAEITTAQDTVSAAAFHETNLKKIQPGHVLIVVRGMILAHSFPTAINAVPIAINQDMKAIELSDDLRPAFLKAALDASKSRILSGVSSAGHGTKRFDKQDMQSISIPIPPIKLQEKFVTAHDQIKRMLLENKASQSKFSDLFYSLQQSAFNGTL